MAEENARRKGTGKKEIPLSPTAIEVVRRIDALFEIERSINGRSPEARLQVRQALSRPLVEGLQVYMREQLAKLSRGHDLAKALKRCASFTLFLDARVSPTMPPTAACGSPGCSADLTSPRSKDLGEDEDWLCDIAIEMEGTASSGSMASEKTTSRRSPASKSKTRPNSSSSTTKTPNC